MKRVKLFESFIGEAARVGSSSWKNILSDLKYDGWEINGKVASKYIGDDEESEDDLEKVEITNNGDDYVQYTVYNTKGKVVNSGSFDAEGLSAGEINYDIWDYINEGVVNEYSSENFTAPELRSKEIIKPKVLAKLLPRTAKTTEEAADRIKSFDGTAMATHVQYFVVRPHGNKEDRPTYRIHEQQYYKWRPNDPKVDVSKLYFLQLKEGANWNDSGKTEDSWDVLGHTFVTTSQWLDELNRVFEVIKRVS